MKRIWIRWMTSVVLLGCAVLLLGGCTGQTGISHTGVAGMAGHAAQAGQAGKGHVRQEKTQPNRGQTDQTDPVQAQSFSYPIDAANWRYERHVQKITGFSDRKGGVITSAADALMLARAECTGSYTRSQVAYDPQNDLWRVTFTHAVDGTENAQDTSGSSGRSGKGLTVYLYPNGIPMLVIVDN